MKKALVFLLTALLALNLMACGQDQPAATDPVATDPVVTDPVATDPVVTDPVATDPVDEGVYSFVYEGVEITPAALFDASALPEADFTYEVPSCALEGTDNVYSYGVIEVTAYSDGENEYVYSIYLADPNQSTPEGLYLGDSTERVTELYGENYEENGTERVYTKGNTLLCIILNDGYVFSIEYRMVTE